MANPLHRARHAGVKRHRPCSRAHGSRRTPPSRACVAGLRRTSPASAHARHHQQARSSSAAQRAAARAAAISRALATQCENTQITPDASNLGAARAAVLCLINHQRAQTALSQALGKRVRHVADVRFVHDLTLHTAGQDVWLHGDRHVLVQDQLQRARVAPGTDTRHGQHVRAGIVEADTTEI